MSECCACSCPIVAIQIPTSFQVTWLETGASDTAWCVASRPPITHVSCHVSMDAWLWAEVSLIDPASDSGLCSTESALHIVCCTHVVGTGAN